MSPIGALLIDKPQGPTSHDIVAFVRRTLKESRVGHTGTLDPLATGLLVVLVGPATRMAQFLAADEKEYLADVRLGVSTPTYDAQSLADGVRCPIDVQDRMPDKELEAVLARFRGTYLQMPPPFSAKKVAGVAAYEKARKNQAVDLKPVPVTVRALERLDTPDLGAGAADFGVRDATLLRLRVAASAGFYVRSLAHDIGQALGCGAHLEALRRTRVGRFRIEDALTLDALERRGIEALIPLNQLLAGMPAVTVTSEGARRAAHGNSLAPSCLAGEPGSWPGGHVRLLDGSGRLLAVADGRSDGLLHPLVVLG